jgi:hypothetical protein
MSRQREDSVYLDEKGDPESCRWTRGKQCRQNRVPRVRTALEVWILESDADAAN